MSMDLNLKLSRLRVIDESIRKLNQLDYLYGSPDRHNHLTEVLVDGCVKVLIDGAYYLKVNGEKIDYDYRFERIYSELTLLVDRVEKNLSRGTGSSSADNLQKRVKKFYEELKSIPLKEEEDNRLLKQKVSTYENVIEAVEDRKQEFIEEAKKEAVSGAQAARISEKIADNYSAYITDDYESGKSVGLAKWMKRLFYWGSNFCEQERKWSQWRSIWLSLLIGIFTFYLTVILINQQHDPINFNTVVYSKIAFFPIVVAVTLAFAFSSRNYRIYANLVHDYRHRKIVASIIENILINDALANGDTKDKVLSKGIETIFEFKSSGHLGKENIEKISLSELVGSLKVEK